MKKKLKRIFNRIFYSRSELLFVYSGYLPHFWLRYWHHMIQLHRNWQTNYRHPVQHIGLEPTILGGIS